MTGSVAPQQTARVNDGVPTYSREQEETLRMYVTSCSLRGEDKMSAGLIAQRHATHRV